MIGRKFPYKFQTSTTNSKTHGYEEHIMPQKISNKSKNDKLKRALPKTGYT